MLVGDFDAISLRTEWLGTRRSAINSKECIMRASTCRPRPSVWSLQAPPLGLLLGATIASGHRMLRLGCVALVASIGTALHADPPTQADRVPSGAKAVPAATDASCWKLDALLAAPEIASVLESGQTARVSLMFGQSRLSAIVARVVRDGRTTLALGPMWVVSVDGLPAIEPSLRIAPFAEAEAVTEPE
ncbi:MAG: hypothetical protein LW806_02260, partial [Planctomycetaceae bacterium]|nr:hypothetical protein [Planctomycetaceae bacterium]